MRSGLGSILCVFSLLVALAGCGSDGGGTTPPPTSNNPPPPLPPPPPPPPPPLIGADGGTVTEASGASVIVPAGAITTDTTIRVARDSTGAPAIPADLTASGSMYVITPHGGEFAGPVEVRIPTPNVTLQPNQQLKIAKAQPGGEWVVLEDTELNAGVLSTKVGSFSFFQPVVVTYLLPLAQAEELRLTTSITCNPACGALIGPVTVTFSVTSNNGQSPDTCTYPAWSIFANPNNVHYSEAGNARRMPIPASGGSFTMTVDPGTYSSYRFGVGRRCGSYGSWSRFGYNLERSVNWATSPAYPNIYLQRMAAQVDVVEGFVANVDAALSGGAAQLIDASYTVPTRTDRAVVEWERSDDNGSSWRVIARSYQDEANSLPGGVGIAWRYWEIRHGFVATASDQGALLRLRACYTPPPTVAAPPCVTSTTGRINVLQQSALPAIVNAPRSVLVRTGQTASLTATASGVPAPTLQWQTRAANSTDAWSDVTTGTGPTSANYTTTATTLADNGVQYRVVATNALGTAESTAMTVSVSDVDVAPTITTQPGSLSVTAGNDAVFAIDARGTEALSYQWRFNGAAIAGANSSVLRLTTVTNANAGSYTVTVSNDAGDADSNAAMLVVSAGTPTVVAPTIVTQPAAVTVHAGNTATFAVGVDGSGPFSFQWRRNGTAIPGATSAVLTLNAVGTSDAASYSVLVGNSANPAGVASNAAALTVTTGGGGAATAPTIVTQPATLVVAPGGSGLLAVAATGSGPLSYQWLNDGVPISGETGAVLTVTNASESYEGRYAVTVSNSLGTVVSQEVRVILLGAPFITQEPAAATVAENTTATFSVVANGPGLRYQWLLNGLTLSGANEASYTTSMLTAASSGAVYSVIVYNGAGVALSQSAVLTVLVFTPPTVAEHPVNTSVDPGSAATLCATFGGTPPFTVQMTRWSGAAWLPVLAARLLYDNSQACTTTPVLQLSDSGARFRFEAASGPGLTFTTNTNPATITVTAPTITATTLASRATSGATANNRSDRPSISADGNVVAFHTDGTNLVPGFTNFGNGYVRNLQTGVTTAVNQMPNGAEPSQGIHQMKLAAGGRYVVFSSLAPGLVADDTNNSMDVFLRDLQTGTTEQLTVLPNGSQLTDGGDGNGDMRLDISADGRYVIFSSFYDYTNTGAPFPRNSLFLRDTLTDQTRVVVSNPIYDIAWAALSSSGEYLAYTLSHFAPNPATVSVLDLETNVSSTIFTLDQTSGADYPHQGLSISGNGRYVAFALRSPALLGTTFAQAVVIDRNDPATLMVASTGSTGSGIGMGNGTSNYPKLSDDGRYVLFRSMSSNISGNIGNSLEWALMLRDLQTQTTTVASRRADGIPVRSTVTAYDSHMISGDGSVVAFTANQTDMGDGSMEYQVYAAPRP